MEEKIDEIFSGIDDFEMKNDKMNSEEIEFLTNCLILNDYIDKNDIYGIQNILDKIEKK